MYRPEDYPELNGKEPEWVASERQMFKEHRDKDGDGKLNQVLVLEEKQSISFRRSSITLSCFSICNLMTPFVPIFFFF